MKQHWVLLTSFGMMLMSSTGVVKRKTELKPQLKTDGGFTEVCVNGNLFPGSGGVNLLPVGFYGNWKEDGVFEVGFQAGDPLEQEVPAFCISKVGTCRMGLSVTFGCDLMSLPFNQNRHYLGFDLTIRDAEGNDFPFSYRENALRISDVFTLNGDFGTSKNNADSANQGYVFDLLPNENTILVFFTLKAQERLVGYRLYYGDTPFPIQNASFYFAGAELDYGIHEVYQGNDCSAKSYTKKVDTSISYRMDVQVGKKLSKSYLLSKFVARDQYDSSEFHVTEVEDPDHYFENGDKAPLGSIYPLTLVARDNQGNETRLRLELHVVDTEGPLIETKESDLICCSYSVVSHDASFVERYYHVADASGSPLRYELKDRDGNEYLRKEIGKKELILWAYDQSGNGTSHPLTLDLFDDIPPEMEVDALELNLSPEHVLPESTLKQFFHVYDEIDGEVEPEVTENTYSENARKVGSYHFTMEAKDKSGNIVSRTIALIVTDTEGPVFYAKESVLTVMQGQIPTVEEMIPSLVRQGVIPDKEYVDYEILEGENIDNHLSVGKHQFRLSLIDVDGGEEMLDLTLDVKEAEGKLPLTGEDFTEEELTFWQKIAKWFKDLFQRIADFFRNLFR